MPTGQHLNHLYYGSGHLHQLNLDGLLISDMERDDLHREVYRSQGKLTSCFGYDAMGRKSWQFASTIPAEKLSQIQNPGINTSLLVDHAYNPIHRRYEYDPAGELVRTLDKLRGEIKYEYEANGQLHSRETGRLVDSEEFRYDAAANRLNFNTSQFDHVKDNRIKRWRDQEYTYDAWGNLIEKRSGLTKLQKFTYDCENRLVRAETLVNIKVHSVGLYRYDWAAALARCPRSMARPSTSISSGKACGCRVRKRRGKAASIFTSLEAMRRLPGLTRAKVRQSRRFTTSIPTRLARRSR